MKTWIKRILGQKAWTPASPDLNQLLPNEVLLNATDDYVVVKKKELESLTEELRELRSRNLSTDARELDLLVANLETENGALMMALKKAHQDINDLLAVKKAIQ
jgi:hypothetical protein